jgi:chemotaxis protein histidine kinase CheA
MRKLTNVSKMLASVTMPVFAAYDMDTGFPNKAIIGSFHCKSCSTNLITNATVMGICPCCTSILKPLNKTVAFIKDDFESLQPLAKCKACSTAFVSNDETIEAMVGQDFYCPVCSTKISADEDEDDGADEQADKSMVDDSSDDDKDKTDAAEDDKTTDTSDDSDADKELDDMLKNIVPEKDDNSSNTDDSSSDTKPAVTSADDDDKSGDDDGSDYSKSDPDAKISYHRKKIHHHKKKAKEHQELAKKFADGDDSTAKDSDKADSHTKMASRHSDLAKKHRDRINDIVDDKDDKDDKNSVESDFKENLENKTKPIPVVVDKVKTEKTEKTEKPVEDKVKEELKKKEQEAAIKKKKEEDEAEAKKKETNKEEVKETEDVTSAIYDSMIASIKKPNVVANSNYQNWFLFDGNMPVAIASMEYADKSVQNVFRSHNYAEAFASAVKDDGGINKKLLEDFGFKPLEVSLDLDDVSKKIVDESVKSKTALLDDKLKATSELYEQALGIAAIGNIKGIFQDSNNLRSALIAKLQANRVRAPEQLVDSVMATEMPKYIANLVIKANELMEKPVESLAEIASMVNEAEFRSPVVASELSGEDLPPVSFLADRINKTDKGKVEKVHNKGSAVISSIMDSLHRSSLDKRNTR